jgi:DNA helicase-2/ATP-dependent DNA helicase PcrA
MLAGLLRCRVLPLCAAASAMRAAPLCGCPDGAAARQLTRSARSLAAPPCPLRAAGVQLRVHLRAVRPALLPPALASLPRRVCSASAAAGGGSGSAAGGSAPPPARAGAAVPQYLSQLNEQQREVVLWPAAPFAPLRVLAAPGSGKTRVLTARVAHLIASGVPAEHVLCITFTRKAAREMRERLDELLGGAARGVVTGTFHSVCTQLLRSHMRHVPGAAQQPSFTIYDAEDAESAIRGALVDLNALSSDEDKVAHKPREFQSHVSRAKSALPRAYAATGGEAFQALVRVGALPAAWPQARVFKLTFDAYTASLARANALDFDDLLSFAVAALAAAPQLAAELAARWPHVLVDEFQDTNATQYEFVRLLAHGGLAPPVGAGAAAAAAAAPVAPGPRSLLVVGDTDQSIYSWRGAEVELMRQRFARDLGAACLPLAANYRSTPQVCAAAEAVLAGSEARSELRVRPVRGAGPPVALWAAATGAAEADAVADEIVRLTTRSAQPLLGAQCAVLYRTNAQSAAFERALLRRNRKYLVVGGTPFFARREIRDLLCYLRLVSNPRDDVAFRRIVNVPSRGISGATLDTLGCAAAAAALLSAARASDAAVACARVRAAHGPRRRRGSR